MNGSMSGINSARKSCVKRFSARIF